MTFQLIYWGSYIHTYPPKNKFTCLPSCFFRLTTRTYLSPQLLVYLPIDVPVHDRTVHFQTFIRITVKIYPSTFLLFYMSTDIPVHHYTCSVYLFLFGIICTMTFQLVYLGSYTHICTRKGMYLFTLMFFFGLTTKTYLSPQLLLYLPIDVPVHDHTCSQSF